MKPTRIALLLAFAVLASTMVFSQGSTYLPQPGRYGLSSWAINNQRVASQYNYYIESLQGSGLGAYTFPPQVIYQALPLGGGKYLNPFNTNAPVKVIDINSANTETVTFTSNTCTTGGGVASVCTLSLNTSNTHTSYILRSGTCGLREALNDLGTGGGEVIVDQRFYDDGCTQSTITGINALVATSTSSGVGPLYQNQYIHDISNGQDTWYGLKPTNNTLISAGSAPTTGTVAGGTFTNGNVIMTYAYVDALGNQSLPSSETTQATGGTTNGLTLTAPAATTGAVGYIVYCTAVGGSTGTEIGCGTGAAGMPNATNCTLTTLENSIPACAIGSNFQVLAPVTSTTKEPILGTAHTAFGFQPFNTFPEFGPSSNLGTFQTLYLPFATTSTITSGSNADVAVAYVPAGYFNRLGASYDVCIKAASTNAATAVPTWTLKAATAYGQSSVTLGTVLLPTQTGAVTTDGCFNLTTAATGSSGTFWTSTPTGLLEAINSTGVVVQGMEVTTAASSAIDLTKPMYLSVNLAAGTANITSVTVNGLQIRPVNGN